MNSTRPYLIRAFYEWIIDNQLTPYVLVNTDVPEVDVPQQYIEDGKIILNISPAAVQDLHISNYWIEFDASFSGQPMQVTVPIKAVLAIYARENGRGMIFDQEERGEEGEGTIVATPPPRRATKKGPRKPKLTIVK